jgi:hypothetical protein
MESWLVRTIRGRRFDRNPLRRPSDRAETLVCLWLFVFFAALAPLAAHAAGGAVSALGEHMQRVALATRHEVTAVTLERAPSAAATPYGQITQFSVNARWTAPDRQRRTGQIMVQGSTPTGEAVKIWVTNDGTMAAPPLQQQEIARLADLAAAGAVIVLAGALTAAWAAAHRALDRQRMAAWEAEWASAGPRWNRQSW